MLQVSSWRNNIFCAMSNVPAYLNKLKGEFMEGNDKKNNQGCCSGNSSGKSCFPHTNSKEMHQMMECMSVCTACSKKCIDEGHKKTAALCAECADVCALAIKAMSSQSEFKQQIMELCAQVCQKCADECKKMQVDHCQECAEICKRCSECCSQVCSKH